ncbi:MAG: ABC transporter substrate-binding protein [Synergistaceae bacterium]|jgi:NitT/TauT family transport system substrate-binding protein|nr:ABC transporter substrate-binding protein [Synergistaceae bacterium]
MKRIISCVLIAVFALSAPIFGGFAEAAPAKLAKFNVGYLASTGHILYFIAKEKGYFEREGLDVNLALFTNSGEGINAVLTGKLDAGSFGTAPPFTFIERGRDIVIFGGQMTEGHAVIAKPDKADALKDINNFKGKTVATVRLATGDIVLRGALAGAGIDWEKDLVINEMESPAAVLEAVKGGKADAGVVWTPFRKMAEDQGLKIVHYSGEYPKMKNHPCCRQIATGANLKANPENYRNFLAALINAYDFYKNNQDDSIEILSKYVNIGRDILVEETYGVHISSSPDPNIAGVAEFWSAMKDAKYITSDIDIREHVNTELFSKALDAKLAESPDNASYKELKAAFRPR